MKGNTAKGAFSSSTATRVMTRIARGAAQIFTRNGHDWTSRMPRLADACNELQVDDAWLDGEAVVLDSSGRPDFNALQNAFDRRSTAEIVMFVFDILWLNGTDLREQPLRSRRALFCVNCWKERRPTPSAFRKTFRRTLCLLSPPHAR
ncbi:hypothetical protein OKW41_000302 [Paraburkholderia sp. UCT70]|uniref:ATP-dependent DNA ligase n=1 Tax=Paraburkholderia sp. UCT70 TaxID=2991068 RepID=UPI003D1E7528